LAQITNAVGLLLIAVGLVGFFVSDSRHWTALLPAILGGVLVLLALLAMRSESGSRHFMHAAMVVALLGVIGSTPRAMEIADGGAMAVVSVITVVLLVVYLALGMRTFIAARRT
jgi:hypothetical protein